MPATTGSVQPGGPALVLDADPYRITKFSVGPADNNCYLIESDDHLLLVDAAAEPGRIAQVLAGRSPSAIVTTHRHHDHIGALADLAAAHPQAMLFCGEPDRAAIAEATGVQPTGVWTGDRIGACEVIGLVGHTPGSITLVLRPAAGPAHLFTGDSLFPGGPGKTATAADFDSLMTDLESRIFEDFEDPTAVHPGHGDDTTLGRERPALPDWRARGW